MDGLRLDVATEAQRAELAPLLSHTFGFPPQDAPAWLERAGHANVLAYARSGGPVVGGLLLVPMGQWFGGRSVSTCGVAGVGIAPEHRSRGVGTRMMTEALRVMRARGASLSTLYPATVPIYQRVGYERAGQRHELVIRPQELERAAAACDDLRVERLEGHESPELRAMQRGFAARTNGALDRGHYIWERSFRPWGQRTVAYALRDGEGLAGHVVLVHRMTDTPENEVRVTDASARDAKAARALFALLAGYRSLAGRVVWGLPAPGPFLPLLVERHYELVVRDTWMLRVLDVAAALEARGYARSLGATLELDIEDAVFPEAGGRFTLELAAGRAHVSRGGRGELRLGVRALAAMYSGFLRASELVRLGWAEGTEQAVEVADEVFAGPTPCMAEMF